MKLSTQQRLMAMNNTVAVLRVLTQLDQTLSHKGYAIAVGLMEPDDKWTAWHRTAVGDVLDATSILTKEPLEFNRIVNAATGKPGIGLLAEPKIRA